MEDGEQSLAAEEIERANGQARSNLRLLRSRAFDVHTSNDASNDAMLRRFQNEGCRNVPDAIDVTQE